MKRSSIIIAFLSTIVQFYDYALFGLSAAALTKAYMPNSTESSGLLSFFVALSAATLMRPIGSIIFGYIGDFRGRAIVLKTACLLAAVSTIVIALLPSNATIFSASCMMLCRMVFMMSMSGEGDGARIYVAESIGAHREYLGNGLVTCCSQIGALLASICWWIASHNLMPEYWWRVNFVLGGLAGLAIFAMRARLEESVEFALERAPAKSQESQEPVVTAAPYDIVVSSASKSTSIFLIATIISGCIGGIYHFQIIFFGTYISKMLGILQTEYAARISILAVLLYVVISPISGYLADRFRASWQSMIGLILMILFSLIGAYCLFLDKFELLWFLFASAAMPLYSVPLQIMLKRKMPISSRLRIFSLSHSIGSVIFSSSVPFICSWIWYSTGFAWLPIIYVVVMCLTLLGCVIVSFADEGTTAR